MKLPKFLTPIIDKNGVLTSRHKKAVQSVSERTVPVPTSRSITVDAGDTVNEEYEPTLNKPRQPTPDEERFHEEAKHFPREERFEGLTITEAARVNRFVRNSGFKVDQWDSFQEELDTVYYPLKGIKWLDYADKFVGNDEDREAYMNFARSWDENTGWLKYPDMSEQEKNAMALASYLTAENDNSHGKHSNHQVGNWSVSHLAEH